MLGSNGQDQSLCSWERLGTCENREGEDENEREKQTAIDRGKGKRGMCEEKIKLYYFIITFSYSALLEMATHCS